MKQDNDIWVFLSHSNKDYEKVREVRNLLEELDFRPLIFFLNCLNEDDEIDSLIKREIDSRRRFILCDSPNAQSSKWVQKEVDYIKSKQRYYYTLDLSESSENIAEKVLEFAKESTVYISCSRKDEHYYEQLKTELYNDLGIRVLDWENAILSGRSFETQIKEMIDKSLLNGYIIFLITDNFLKSPFCYKELEYVLQKQEFKHIIVLRDIKTERPRIENYNSAREYICELKDDNLHFQKSWLYWIFFRDRIQDGVSKGDPASLYWQAYHFYWDDDRFDNSNMENMRLAALSMAKRSMDKGFYLAVDLYNKIINDYPELESKLNMNIANISMKKNYIPQPMDTNDVQLPEELNVLIEQMAKNVHEVWAQSRMEQGWTYGEERSDALKTHPCLIPYEELPEVEKAYDRDTAVGTLKLIMKLGFNIT